jgi:hypothetical protein
MRFDNIFSHTHVLQHHLSSHYFTSWIKQCFPFFLENYELDQELEISFDSFKLTFQCMPNLFISGLFGMGFEHFQNSFHPWSLMSGFS